MRLQNGLTMTGLLGVLLVLSACSPSSEQPTTVSAAPIEGTWIDAAVVGDTATVPLALVQQDVNTHFTVDAGGRTLVFMAYMLGGEVQVRANVCPPCRSRGFALYGDTLVCDTCATTFDARDGSGISGACVDYPKASVECHIVDGAISMAVADLSAAYDETLVAG